MVECGRIIEHMQNWAPESLAEDWDNVGLQVGSKRSKINKVLVCLEVNNQVIDEAITYSVDMIISHHPLIYKPLKSISFDDYRGNIIYRLIKEGIALYCAHTNLDAAAGGVNDELAKRLRLVDIEQLDSFARLGEIDKDICLDTSSGFRKDMCIVKFAEHVKQCLNTEHVRIIGKTDNASIKTDNASINENNMKPIRRVVVSSGSYDSAVLDLAISRTADVIVSGDIKYHNARDIVDANIYAIDAGHFSTEYIIVPVIADYLKQLGIETICSKISLEPFEFI